MENKGAAKVMSVFLLRLHIRAMALVYLIKNSLLDFRPLVQLSRDEGASWREASDWWALPVKSRTGLKELADGRVQNWMRTYQGVQYGYWSTDGGGANWRRHKPLAQAE